MIEKNDFFIILAEMYEIKISDNIYIFSLKLDNIDKINKNRLSEYKIIFKFAKKSSLLFKIGISLGLKKIKCKFGSEEFNINTVKHFNLFVEPDDIFTIELKSLKKYFEIYVGFDQINLSDREKSYLELCSQPYSQLQIKKIIIVLSKYIESIGYFFKLIFESRGYECEYINSLSLLDCIGSTPDQIYIIIYSNQTHLGTPSRFIYYQVEQPSSIFLSNHQLLKKTIYMMTKAEQVWEYSIGTRKIYSKYCENKLKWVPMPYYYIENFKLKLNQTQIDLVSYEYDLCEYDIFFYGHPNERRKKILDKLSKYFKIKIGFGIYADEKIKYINKSKIIINLHFYRDAGLETCRINEILNYNKLIISEKSQQDNENMELYIDHVIFVDEINQDMSNLKQMIKTIQYYLKKKNYLNKIDLDKKMLSDKIIELIKI